MKDKSIHLNPFLYISETDIRFYLIVLLGILMPFSWGSALGAMIFKEPPRFYITIPTLSLIPLFIYWSYKRFPKNMIKESKLKELDKKEIREYIEKLHKKYLPNVKQPTLMYQFRLDKTAEAFAFGTRNNMYIGLSTGLIYKYRSDRDGFKSILLHEMGHIANRDEKAYIVASTWRSIVLGMSLPLVMYLLYHTYTMLEVIYSGIRAGYDIEHIIFMMNLKKTLLMYGGILFYFLIVFVIVYVLKNQIIRLREFYADAKVLEWERCPEKLIETLIESGGNKYSTFKLLTKFHPNIDERIRYLKNNSSLFIPSLWVAFSLGFSYGLIDLYSEQLLWIFRKIILTPLLSSVFRALFSPLLILTVSSSFHKSIMKDGFIDNKPYFSIETLINIIKFSLIYSFAWLFGLRIVEVVAIHEIGIRTVMSNLFTSFSSSWIPNIINLFWVLLFLVFFASMLIRRSFSKKEAEKNFLMVTVISSTLYIIFRYFIVELSQSYLQSYILRIFAVLIYYAIAYILIRIRDRKLTCLNCDTKILNPLRLKIHCPNCQYNLYSWVYHSMGENLKQFPQDTENNRSRIENMRNLLEISAGIAIFNFVANFDLSDYAIPELFFWISGLIFFVIFIHRSSDFSLNPNINQFKTLNNFFYGFVASTISAIAFGIMWWEGYISILSDLLFLVILVYLLNSYITDAEKIVGIKRDLRRIGAIFGAIWGLASMNIARYLITLSTPISNYIIYTFFIPIQLTVDLYSYIERLLSLGISFQSFFFLPPLLGAIIGYIVFFIYRYLRIRISAR